MSYFFCTSRAPTLPEGNPTSKIQCRNAGHLGKRSRRKISLRDYFFSAVSPAIMRACAGTPALKNALSCNFSAGRFANVHFFLYFEDTDIAGGNPTSKIQCRNAGHLGKRSRRKISLRDYFFSAVSPAIMRACAGTPALKNALSCNFSAGRFANVHFFLYFEDTDIAGGNPTSKIQCRNVGHLGKRSRRKISLRDDFFSSIAAYSC